jgi:hypothetical protein
MISHQQSAQASATSMSYANLSYALREHIQQHGGPGEWAFIAPVSKDFQADYVSALPAAVRRTPFSASDHRRTTYRAAVASVPRLEQAISSGLIVEFINLNPYNHSDYRYRVAFAAGPCASKEVLLWLKERYDLVWGASVCAGAIQAGRLDVLKWLHEEQDCFWDGFAGGAAALADKLPILQYIHSLNDGGIELYGDHPVSALQLLFSLNAMRSNNPELLEWCHSQGLLVLHRRLYTDAVASGCAEAAEWLQQHGLETELDSVNGIEGAADFMAQGHAVHHGSNDADTAAAQCWS